MKTPAWLLLAVGLVTLLADQGTKYLAVAHLTPALASTAGAERLTTFVTARNLEDRIPVERREGYSVVEGFWRFRYTENSGAAWGLLATLPQRVRQPFFFATSLLALAVLSFLLMRTPSSLPAPRLALSLVLGGALGNFLDRLVRGYVIDFIDVHWRDQLSLRWPTFNLADTAMTLGIAFILIDSFRLAAAEGGAEGLALSSPGGSGNPNS